MVLPSMPKFACCNNFRVVDMNDVMVVKRDPFFGGGTFP